jgi:hypothetical protein
MNTHTTHTEISLFQLLQLFIFWRHTKTLFFNHVFIMFCKVLGAVLKHLYVTFNYVFNNNNNNNNNNNSAHAGFLVGRIDIKT